MINKIVIVGCGNVGMSYAYALVNQKCNVNKIVLIDLDKEKAMGEADDLNHGIASLSSNVTIEVGSYEDCRDAKIICITAGTTQSYGEKRIDLLNKNNKILKPIIDNIMTTGFDGIFLIATNPLDIMTYLTIKYSKVKYNRVIGSGTSLDTARLKYFISNKTGIDTKNIHAYVIGEHGDNGITLWYEAKIGIQSIDRFINEDEKKKIEKQVIQAGYDIIKKKGSSYYGIGICLANITKAILNDENTIITVSSYQEKDGICYSLPTVINKNGIKRVYNLDLKNDELTKLNNCINIIRDECNKLRS